MRIQTKHKKTLILSSLITIALIAALLYAIGYIIYNNPAY